MKFLNTNLTLQKKITSQRLPASAICCEEITNTTRNTRTTPNIPKENLEESIIHTNGDLEKTTARNSDEETRLRRRPQINDEQSDRSSRSTRGKLVSKTLNKTVKTQI